MKERLITLGGALLAFYAVYILLLPKPVPPSKPISLATTEDRSKHGLAAAYKWLNHSQVNTLALQDRYHGLYDNPALAASGNLLIVSLPLRVESRAWEEQQLQTWLSEGNTLVLLTAMSDWPEWAKRYTNSVDRILALFDYRLENGTPVEPGKEKELERKTDKNEQSQKTGKKDTSHNDVHLTEPRTLVPTTSHPILTGISTLTAEWKKTEGLDWIISGREGLRSLLVLLRDKKNQTPAFWQGRYGQGLIYVSRHADLFSNASLAEADNARLLGNLINMNLGPDGYVIFDDMHQGLSKLYDPDAFYSDPRFTNTLLFLLVLWLTYLLGHTNRFQPIDNKYIPMRLADHIRAIGDFVSARLESYAVAQRMFFHFFNEIRRYHGMARNGQPAWEELAKYSQINPEQIYQLRTYYQRIQNQQSVNLVKLTQLINKIRKKLS